MVLNPGMCSILYAKAKSLFQVWIDVQKKAQAEIDSVIGNDRLPGIADRPHLPYINAVLTEVLRWNSVAPTGWNFSPKHA